MLPARQTPHDPTQTQPPALPVLGGDPFLPRVPAHLLHGVDLAERQEQTGHPETASPVLGRESGWSIWGKSVQVWVPQE